MYAFHVQMPSAFGKVSVLTAAGFGGVFFHVKVGQSLFSFWRPPKRYCTFPKTDSKASENWMFGRWVLFFGGRMGYFQGQHVSFLGSVGFPKVHINQYEGTVPWCNSTFHQIHSPFVAFWQSCHFVQNFNLDKVLSKSKPRNRIKIGFSIWAVTRSFLGPLVMNAVIWGDAKLTPGSGYIGIPRSHKLYIRIRIPELPNQSGFHGNSYTPEE